MTVTPPAPESPRSWRRFVLWGLAALVMLPLLLLGGGLLIFLQGVASNNASRLEALPANQARFEAFIDGVEAETGWRVLVTSGYRSPAQQKKRRRRIPMPPKAAADTVMGSPSTSTCFS